ncbi:MAG: serine/threonine protein kinase [Bdellovibrionales bacterium]
MYTSPVQLFYSLTPDAALESIEKQGFELTGRYTQLNSYENRVFSLELEAPDESPNLEIIAKFYRPGRWSKEAILEEHSFLKELNTAGVPAIAPLSINGETIFPTGEIHSTIFPKALGRIPQELSQEELKQVGRLLARLHNVGAQSTAKHRPTISTKTYGDNSLQIISPLIPQELSQRYLNAADDVLNFLDERLDESKYIRIHGDCHKGNLLQTDPIKGPKEYFFVDFDDFCNGPVVQDFWMLFSGDNENLEKDSILSGYTELRTFDESDFELMNGLRGLRMIYYSSWIAMRWEDPSFQKIFDNFKSYNYWADQTDQLEKIIWAL